MPRGRGYISKTKKMVNDKELTDMFNKMLGMEEPDPSIAKPRCETFNKLINKLIIATKRFSENEKMLKIFPNEKENFKKINNFSSRLSDLVKRIETTTSTDIGKVYMDVKKDHTVKSLFVIHTQLKAYRECIEDLTALSDLFIINDVGYEIYPFKKLCKMNLYSMWTKDPPQIIKKNILMFLHQMYKTTKELCELLMKPDVDISKFSELLIECISQAKKLIPNCNDAFRRIEKAVGLLQENFDGYYKDFIKTEDPSIIFLDFIGDVANAQKNADLKLIVQFRKIVKFFQNSKAGQNNDPRMKSIFKILNQNVSMLEKNVDGNISDLEDEEDFNNLDEFGNLETNNEK